MRPSYANDHEKDNTYDGYNGQERAGRSYVWHGGSGIEGEGNERGGVGNSFRVEQHFILIIEIVIMITMIGYDYDNASGMMSGGALGLLDTTAARQARPTPRLAARSRKYFLYFS